MKPLYIIALSLISSSLLFVSCKKKAEETTTQKSEKIKTETNEIILPVKTLKIVKQDYKGYSDYIGTVNAIEKAILIAHGGGRVQSLFAKEGDKVTKNKKLCNIDAEKFENGYQSAKLNEKITKQEYERKKVHLRRGSVSQLQVDQAKAQYLVAKSQTFEAEKVKDGATCISPINGVVVERLVENFEFLPLHKPTFIVADLDKVKVNIGIPESEISGFKENGTANLFLSDETPLDVEGKVTRVSKNMNDATKTFNVEVIADNKDNTLLPGQMVRVKLLRYDLTEKIVIPTSAIVTIAKEQYVYVVKDSRAIRTKISIFTRDSKKAVIKSGINEGETIITSGQARVGDGAKVNVLETH